MNDHLHALPIDYLLGEYRIVRAIGSGGFGITYYAEDTNLNKLVAIKEYLPNEFAVRTDKTTIKPKSSTDQKDYQWGLERFLDEARTLAHFKHPHLNEVHRFFEDNGTAYLVLEYIEGETLAQLLKREQRLHDDRLHRLLHELLSGLDEVHKAGYVHRDIKPGNIMLRRDGSSILLDFGAARQAVGQRSKSITSILTPGYAPIEQYDQQADDIGAWTDLYALGMVAYRCIAGSGDNVLVDAVARARLERKGDRDKDMTPAVKVGKGKYAISLLETIDQAIKVDEKERLQSVADMISALGPSSVGSPAPETSSRPPAQAVSNAPASPSRDWLTPMLVLIIVIGVAVWSWPRFEEFIAWRTVQCDNAVQVESHLARYANGRYKQIAEGCLAQIKLKGQEEEIIPASPETISSEDWAKLQCDDKEEMQAYLEQYPDGLNRQAATDCIVKAEVAEEKQDWSKLQCDDKGQMQEYLAQYPDGLNRQAAADCIVKAEVAEEQQDWAKLQCDDKGQMQVYLEQYSEGINRQAAVDCIATIKQDEDRKRKEVQEAQEAQAKPKADSETVIGQLVTRKQVFSSKRIKSKMFSYVNTTDTWVVEATPGYVIQPDTAQFDFVLQSSDKGCSRKRSSSRWALRSAEKLVAITVAETPRRGGRSCRSEITIHYKEIAK